MRLSPGSGSVPQKNRQPHQKAWRGLQNLTDALSGMSSCLQSEHDHPGFLDLKNPIPPSHWQATGPRSGLLTPVTTARWISIPATASLWRHGWRRHVWRTVSRFMSLAKGERRMLALLRRIKTTHCDCRVTRDEPRSVFSSETAAIALASRKIFIDGIQPPGFLWMAVGITSSPRTRSERANRSAVTSMVSQ